MTIGKIFVTLLLFFLTPAAFSQENYLLVGTYDSPKSEGIYVYRFNSKGGSSDPVSHVKTFSPSYLAISPDQKFVYAVNERSDSTSRGGGVSSFHFNKLTGMLSLMNQQSSEGNNPCYVTVDKTGRRLYVANYSTGNLSVLQILPGGILTRAMQVIQHTGRSVDTPRQHSAHVHCTILNEENTILYAADLGTDRIEQYSVDLSTGELFNAHIPSIGLKPGSGPRHLDISKDGTYMYVLEELSGYIEVLKLIKQQFWVEGVQKISALPPDHTGSRTGSADIHISPDGKFLYVSNRGISNTIGIFSIDKDSGMLRLVGHQTTYGERPRNFSFDPSGNFLLVANQMSDEIVIFKVNKSTGLLTDTGKRIPVGRPVCIKWISVD